MTRASVPLDVARSWLLTPAQLPHRITEAVESDADAIILDLEDGVPRLQRPNAIDAVVHALDGGVSAWVRINEHGGSRWHEDLDAIRGLPGLMGVMLAKTESPSAVSDTWRRLGKRLPVLPLVESALGIRAADSIACEPGTARLAFGIGDYRRDTGSAASDRALAYPRSRLVVASRAARLPGPIDGPTRADDDDLREACRHATELGMTGKLCLSERESALTNGGFGPEEREIRAALTELRILDALPDDEYDGSVAPRRARAESVLRTAAILGLSEPALAN